MNTTEKLLALSKIMPFQCELSLTETRYHYEAGDTTLTYKRDKWKIEGDYIRVEEPCLFAGSGIVLFKPTKCKPILHPFSKLNSEVTVPNELAVSLLADVGIEVKVGDKVNAWKVLEGIYEDTFVPLHKSEYQNHSNFKTFFNAINAGRNLIYLNIAYDILRSLHFAVDFPEGEFEVIK